MLKNVAFVIFLCCVHFSLFIAIIYGLILTRILHSMLMTKVAHKSIFSLSPNHCFPVFRFVLKFVYFISFSQKKWQQTKSSQDKTLLNKLNQIFLSPFRFSSQELKKTWQITAHVIVLRRATNSECSSGILRMPKMQ